MISEMKFVVWLWRNSDNDNHPGIDKTFELMRRNFWWPSLHADVCEYVANCDACQRAKSRTQQSPGLLQLLPIPAYPWQHVTIDFFTGLFSTWLWLHCCCGGSSHQIRALHSHNHSC